MDRNINNQFPEFDDKETYSAVLKELCSMGFEDQCWHNEAMPQIAREIDTESDDKVFQIWIDYKDVKLSEIACHDDDGKYAQFAVCITKEYGEEAHIYKLFTSADELIAYVKDYFRKKENSLIDDWTKFLSDEKLDETLDAQGALLEDLTANQRSFVTDFVFKWQVYVEHSA